MRRDLGVLGGTAFILSACLLTGAVTSGCGSKSSSSSTTAVSQPSPSTTRTTTESSTVTTAPSAANDLAAYFAAALRRWSKAVAANGAIGTNEITISQSTIDAVKAADPSAAAREIPAGLPPDVLLPVLTVQSDLVSRFYAFRGFSAAQLATIPRVNPMPGSLSSHDYLLTCLVSGAEAAMRAGNELAASAPLPRQVSR